MRIHAFRSTLFLLLLLLTSGPMFLSFMQLAHADECPAGTSPASADEPAVKNGTIKVDTCYRQNEVAIGRDAEEARQFLLSRYAPGNCSAKNASREEGIMRLNADFANRLAKMLKAAPMQLIIISAYRSPEAQRCANPEVTNSNHTKGLAVDMQWDRNSCSSAACQWVLRNGPTYGIHIRMKYAPEWNHLEPNGAVSGGLGGDPSAPTSPLSNAIRQALGLQTQQPQAPLQPTSVAQPISSGSSYTSAQPSASSGSTQTETTPVSGTISTNTNTNTNSNTNVKATTTTATSTFEEILEYADPVSDSIDIGSPALINLNDDVSGTVSRLYPVNSRPQGATGTVASAYVTPPQTFTSPDLAQNPSGFSGTGQQDTTFLVRLYTTLRDSLVLVLQYLRPFGGRAGLQGD